MNCQEILLALDDRDLGALNEAERHEFDAHVAACPDCAQDWEIHQRMLAAASPAMPASFPAQVRGLVVARSRFGGGPRVRNRFVLLGAVLAIGAAAAMLGMRMMATLASPSQVAASTPVSTPAVAPEATGNELQAAAPAPEKLPHEEKQAEAKAIEVTAAVKPFTVRLLSLQNDAKEPSNRASVVTLYEAFLERLRGVPGLTLLDPGPENAQEPPPDFRITMTGREVGKKAGSFGGMVRADIVRPDGTVRTSSLLSSGELMVSCMGFVPANSAGGEPSVCVDAAAEATILVEELRERVFPPDPSFRRQLELRVADRSRDAKQRLTDMLALSRFGLAYVWEPVIAATPGEALRDPVVLRGAIDLATNTPDPLLRAEVWATLRGVGSAELARPLLSAFRRDANSEVRLAALATLAADFSTDPRVRSAFETAAQRDTRPLIRAVAQRTLAGFSGDAAWDDYVITSLKDTNRSAVERTEALFYHLGLPVETRSFNGVRAPAAASIFRQFDREAIQAVISLLPAVADESSSSRYSVISLFRDLVQLDDAAVNDALIAGLRDGSQSIDRIGAIQSLVRLPSLHGDPRVHATLEKISTDDPDPRLREMASAFLQGKPDPSLADVVVTAPAANASAGVAPPPPRFGVNLSSLVAGPFVPPDMVGKAVVASVTPDSVSQRAGVKEGDLLLEVNGTPLSKPAEIVKIAADAPKGVDVEVVVYRAGQRLSLKARF